MMIRSGKQTNMQATDVQMAKPVIGLFIVLVFCAFVLLLARGLNQNNDLVVPPEFQHLTTIDLAARSYDGYLAAQFTVEETAVVRIFYTIPNIDIDYFDLRLIGSNGDSFLILKSQDYRTDKNGSGLWEQRLEPGDYRLELNAPQTPGILSVYWAYR